MIQKVLILFILFITFSLNSWSQSVEQRVYIKKSETFPLVSIFSKPGLNWKNCERNQKGECVDGVGWLDSDSKVSITGEKITVKVIDPFTDQEVEEEYYPIEFEYSRSYQSSEIDPRTGKPMIKTLSKKKGQQKAWIEAAYISETKIDDHPYLQGPPNFEMCTKKEARAQEINRNLAKNLSVASVDGIVNEIFPRIGMCTSLKDAKPGGNLYDNAILNRIKAAGVPPGYRKSDGTPVTPEDLVEIDSLARTIYGEMASCFKHGIQYPMAVARIAMNRVEFSRKLENENKNRKKKVTDPFIQGPHDPRKTHLSKVVTSPIQFNAWLRKLNNKGNPSMNMALCPARDPNQKMLDGRNPGPQELAVWRSSVKIAADAVLNRKEFLEKTAGVSDIKNYTSAMGKFYGMKKQNGRRIAGLEVNKDSCVELWKD